MAEQEGGAVQMRRLWTVLVLAAVISMHGTPALAGDSGAQSAVNEAVAAPGPIVPLAAHASADTDMRGESLQQPMESHSSGHGVDAHLWAACLAVLLAGVTIVAAAAGLWRGLASPVRAPAGGIAWPRRWRFVRRPPDLSVLCLLRV